MMYIFPREMCHPLLTSRQGILKDLLETQELENGQVDGRVQPQAALVWAQGRVELHTEAAVHLDLALVVLPDDTELDDALGDGDDLEGSTVFGVLLEQGAGLKGRGKLVVGLLELGLGGEVGHVRLWGGERNGGGIRGGLLLCGCDKKTRELDERKD